MDESRVCRLIDIGGIEINTGLVEFISKEYRLPNGNETDPMYFDVSMASGHQISFNAAKIARVLVIRCIKEGRGE
jgi:hypothetical protein